MEAWGYVEYDHSLSVRECAKYGFISVEPLIYWGAETKYDDDGRVDSRIITEKIIKSLITSTEIWEDTISI